MKLRVRGSSLRLRLTRTEVESLRGVAGRVEDHVQFGPTSRLTYAIVRGDGPVRATFEGSAVTVTAPEAIVSAWAGSDEVGFEAEQATGDGSATPTTLRILVEKDWNCLTSRPGEEDVDTFPNPNVSC